MSLPWVKLHTSLLDNETFQRFTPAAKLTFLTALMIAGKQDLGGRLEAPPFGAIDSKAIASKTGCRAKYQDEALSELVTAGFLSVDLNGTYIVERWEEKAGDESRLLNQRARSKRYRDTKRHVTTNEQANVTNVTDKEEEEELVSSLRSEIAQRVEWPDVGTPEFTVWARVFTIWFSGAKDPVKVQGYQPYYSDALAAMRGRSVTPAEAYKAFEAAVQARSKPGKPPKPLFSSARTALSYLPAWRDRNGRSKSSTEIGENSRGSNFKRTLARNVARDNAS